MKQLLLPSSSFSNGSFPGRWVSALERSGVTWHEVWDLAWGIVPRERFRSLVRARIGEIEERDPRWRFQYEDYGYVARLHVGMVGRVDHVTYTIDGEVDELPVAMIDVMLDAAWENGRDSWWLRGGNPFRASV